ncbi:histone-lysine N-methyltransferase SETMAR [Elysia marginata]|uniref:Histone-lysine N-methyltransferase SETMAR n=1 Tax=Elysia marginata TaxID=1093978 RepID=A0AAV4GDZ8_9GAST|nr:histone-lysine N-methyltransferase SETMAR [Elysia marginata]
MILDNRCIRLKNIAKELEISKERVQHTITDILGYRKVSASPDLAPSDFYLFPKLKEHLRGNHYESDEDVEAAVRHWFRKKCVDFFTDGMHQLVRRWQLCGDRDGDYVEK